MRNRVREIILEDKPPINKFHEIKEKAFNHFYSMYSSEGSMDIVKIGDFLAHFPLEITKGDNHFFRARDRGG